MPPQKTGPHTSIVITQRVYWSVDVSDWDPRLDKELMVAAARQKVDDLDGYNPGIECLGSEWAPEVDFR